MRTLKMVIGYIWAGLGIPLFLTAAIGEEFWIEKLMIAPGFKVAAWAKGGEIVQTIEHDTYRTSIHRPVFDGLFWEKQTGFVQVDWSSEQPLPEQIHETLDLDGDGSPDARVALDTQKNTAVITPLSPSVIGLSREAVLIFEQARTVRVVLRNLP
jgi:hypothetical protein